MPSGKIPTINVELADPKLVQDPKDKSKYKIEGTGVTGRLVTMTGSDLVGSKIAVHGRGVESKSNNDKECLAKSIEVTLMAPLTGSKPASAAAKQSAADDKQQFAVRSGHPVGHHVRAVVVVSLSFCRGAALQSQNSSGAMWPAI